jgi:hypothetical protein
MMKLETIEQQILRVLGLFSGRCARGEPLREALRDAAREVAADVNVAHQTVVDGFTRRLQLDTIDELYDLLQQWADGDPGPLAAQLKANSDRSAHQSIDAFFESPISTGNTKRQRSADASSEAKLDTFSFDLPEDEARVLRTFAANAGVSEAEFSRQAVRIALAGRMKAVAQDLMR